MVVHIYKYIYTYATNCVFGTLVQAELIDGISFFFLEALLSSSHFLGRAQWLENTEHTLGIWKIEMIISSQFWLGVVLNYVLHISMVG